MQKYKILNKLIDSGIVAVIRGNSPAEAFEIVRECVRGGIKAIELTFTVPYAHEIISELTKEFSEDVLIGAGTVLDSETARIAILCGSKFIVSPSFDEETMKLCNRYAIPYLPGIATINEAIIAMEKGADILKLFPGELYGPKAIKAIKGPLPYANIMPTGGVDIDNIAEWVDAGAVALGVGSALTKVSSDISSNYDISSTSIKGKAEAFISQLNKARANKKA